MIPAVSYNRRRTWMFALLLPMVLAVHPLAAQKPKMLNMQYLACYYSPGLGELELAMYSMSQQTDPKLNFGFRRELEIELETAEGKTLIRNGDLKVAVIGDLVRDIDRKYKLFRFNIVVDESSSINDSSLMKAREIIAQFLRRIPVCYEAQVIRFSSTPQVATGFTNDPDVLISALNEPRFCGGTAFYDAIDQALTELKQASGEIPLNFTIAFTDGADTSSDRFSNFNAFQLKISSVTEREQIPIFLAGIGDGINHTLLGEVAGKMGLYMPLDGVPDVGQLFDAVANVIEKTYIIRIPMSSTHRDIKTVYILRRKSSGSHETIQDVPLPAVCSPTSGP